MDGLTLIGLILGFAAILVGQILEGGSIYSLLNGPALLIVLGGTIGAVFVQTPIVIFKKALRLFWWTIFPPKFAYQTDRQRLVDLAKKSRQYGLLTLEEYIDTEENPILKQGLELLVIGVDKNTIRDVLETEVARVEDFNHKAAGFFEAMGGYSPTIGIIGAVLGLIQVMGNLTEPSELGAGIAVAFVATIYGVGFANLLFLPIANKIKLVIAEQTHHNEMLVEGIVSMASGESPNMLDYRLVNYGQHHG
ncbi:flagellar motor protein [Legionella sp. W05-934-2]|jgi:chemotaxis protein MotA|uniref:flagellar motor protein n=1 Tax=Legionella sp. W05-934-2 TaxID=1198649 RepID=UPI003461FBEB